MDKEHLAKEAERLVNEPLLQMALENMKQNAMVNLVSVNATDADEIRDWQAIAKVIEEFQVALRAEILATGKEDGGFNPNEEPTE